MDFPEYLQRRGLSPRTVGEYQRVILDLDAWLRRRHSSIWRLNPDLLASYAASKPQSWSTQKTIRASVDHWWASTKRKDPPTWVLSIPKKPEMVCRAMAPKDAVRYARAARRSRSPEGLAMLLGLYLGLRAAEIAACRRDQFSHGWVRITGKGGRTREIPAHPILLDALARHPVSPNGYLFPGRIDGHIHKATVRLWAKRFADEHQLPRVNPHRLRHTCLATANDITKDLRAVQEFAGHARPETTAGYTRAKRTRLTAVMRSLGYGATG